MNNEKKHILIALSGMSPAVLTEAVWGLATGPDRIVPDKVVVLTTAKGRALIQDRLLKDGIWEKLKAALSKRGVDVKGKLVFEEEMPVFTYKGKAVEDLTTRELNLEAANAMMRVIRDSAEDGDCVIHALMAGGRKTMSALFFSSMCLLGRKCDHVYHVLVSEGYDDFRLQPPFYFPQKGVVHKTTREVLRGKKRVSEAVALKSEDCKINLFDVPFVPMGEWAEQKCKAISRRLSYENVINAVNAGIDGDVYPKVAVDLSGRGCVTLDGVPFRLPHFEFVLLSLVVQGRCASECLRLMRELKDYMCLGDDVDEQAFDNGQFRWLENFMGDETKRSGCGKFAWYGVPDKKAREMKIAQDLTRTLSVLRKTLPKKPSIVRLLDRDGFPSDFDCANVAWSGYENLPKGLRERFFLPETRRRLGI